MTLSARAHTTVVCRIKRTLSVQGSGRDWVHGYWEGLCTVSTTTSCTDWPMLKWSMQALQEEVVGNDISARLLARKPHINIIHRPIIHIILHLKTEILDGPRWTPQRPIFQQVRWSAKDNIPCEITRRMRMGILIL